MEKEASDQPASGTAAAIADAGPLGRGIWIGAIFAAGAVASWPIMWALGYVLDSTWLSNLAAGSIIAIFAIGYLAGLAAAIKRPTRRLGLGILIGVTVAAPVLFMLTWKVLYAIWGGQ
jgi:hypothetical protein